MTIRLMCPHCNSKLNIPDDLANKKVRCQKCAQTFQAPKAGGAGTTLARKVSSLRQTQAHSTSLRPEPRVQTRLPRPAENDDVDDLLKDVERETKGKPRAKRKSGGSGGTIVLLFLLFVMLGGAGTAVWFFYDDIAGLFAQSPTTPKDSTTKASTDKPPDKVVEAPKLINGVPFAGDLKKTVFQLPAKMADVAYGRDHRLLIILLPTIKQLVVYDIEENRIALFVPLRDRSGVKFAAGSEKLVVLQPSDNSMQIWNLKTLQLESEKQVPLPNIKNICMGAASMGPLAVLWGFSSPVEGRAFLSFFDPDTLKPLKTIFQGPHEPDLDAAKDYQLRASSDGKVIAGWCTTPDAGGVFCASLAKGTFEYHQDRLETGPVVPSSDGKLLCSVGRIFTPELQLLVGDRKKMGHATYVPVLREGARFNDPGRVDPDYLLLQGRGEWKLQQQRVTISAHLASDDRQLVVLPEFGLAAGGERERSPVNMLTSDRRISYAPREKRLIVLPEINNEIDVYNLDVQDVIDKAGLDFFYITSQPPRKVVRGERYVYQIDAVAKKGIDSFELLTKVDPSMKMDNLVGQLEWNVPKTWTKPDVDVLIRVIDKGGQRTTQQFKINVIIPPEPFEPKEKEGARLHTRPQLFDETSKPAGAACGIRTLDPAGCACGLGLAQQAPHGVAMRHIDEPVFPVVQLRLGIEPHRRD